MPTLPEVIAKLSFLRASPAVAGLVVTAALIIVVRDWRVSLMALLAQYLLLGFLLTRLLLPEVATVKTLVGALICPILYLTARSGLARQVEEGRGYLSPGFAAQARSARRNRQGSRSIGQETFSPGRPFRLLAAILIGLVTTSLLNSYPPPEVPRDIGFACYWLGLMGLLAMILTTEPLRAGLGLLTFMSGFELFYAALESSLSVIGLLGIVNLLMALAIAYLASAKEPAPEAGGREGTVEQ